MSNLKLNKCGDLAIEGGRLVVVRGADEIRQNWFIRVRTFQGEWFLDQNIGVPYFDVPQATTRAVTNKLLTRPGLQAIFADVTRNTPGVIRVDSVVVDDINVATREASVTVRATINAEEDSAIFVYDGVCPPGLGGVSAANVVVGGDNVVVGGDNVVIV